MNSTINHARISAGVRGSDICPAILAIAVFLPVTLNAQSVCENILKSANYNQYHSVSTIDQGSVTKANLCIADYSSATKEQQAQISASYGLFSGTAGGSTTDIMKTQHNECGGHYGAYWFSQLNLSDQKVVSDAALNAVKDCVDKYAQGLKVESHFSEPDEKAISIHLTWQHQTPLPLRRITMVPQDAATCLIEGQNITDVHTFDHRTIAPGGSVTLTCTRNAKAKVISGETVECYAEGLIAIDVTDSPATIPIFRHCSTDYLSSRAAQVDAQVLKVRATLATLTQQVQGIQQQVQGVQGITSGLKAAQYFEISYSQMQTFHSGCNNVGPALTGSLTCGAAAQGFCKGQGFAGGFPQQANNAVLGFVCVK